MTTSTSTCFRSKETHCEYTQPPQQRVVCSLQSRAPDSGPWRTVPVPLFVDVPQLLALLVSIFAATALAACTQEVVREVPVTEVVTQEVIREVPVEKIVEVERETVRTIEVEKPVEVVKEVVKEVQVPGETVVVEKEVVREVMVPGQTVVVEKEVVREVPRDVVVTKEVVREVEKIVEVDPRMGGTLRYASGVGLKFLDSQHTTAGVTADANQMAYEGLFHSDLEEIQQPMLVDNFAITDGGLKWTLKLREGINFHNGEPLTAQDIIGSFTCKGRSNNGPARRG